MLKYIQKHFHISQVTVPRNRTNPTHHRALVLLCALTLICQQFGMMQSFAAYVVDMPISNFIKGNAQKEASWIGNPIPYNGQKINTKPLSSVTKDTSKIVTIEKNQKTETTDSWIGIVKKSENILQKKPKPNFVSKNDLGYTFAAAPNSPTWLPGYEYPTTFITQSVFDLAASYPSGNPGKTVNSTTDVPEGANLYFSEKRAQDALSGTSLQLTQLVSQMSTTGTGVFGNIQTHGIGSFSGITVTNTGSFRNIDISETGYIHNMITDLITAIKGVFDELVATVLRATTATIETLTSNSIITKDITATGSADFNTAHITHLNTQNTITTSGNIITSNVGGSVATGSIITQNTLSISGNILSTEVNNISSTTILTTANISESGANLYYSDLRAQNALSGVVETLSGNIAINSANISTATGDISILSQQIANLSVGNSADTSFLSGNIAKNAIDITTLSGRIYANETHITTNTADIYSLSGNMASISGIVLSNYTLLSDRITTNETNISSASGRITTNATDISSLSGKLLNLSNTVTGFSTELSTASGTISNLTSSTGSISMFSSLIAAITNITTDLITGVKGVFDELVATVLRATTATIETLTSNSIITKDITATGSADFNTAIFSGNVIFKQLPSVPLSQGALLVGDSSNKASELRTGSGGQVLVIAGGIPVWTDSENISPILSVFGRSGSITAQSGDYTTDQVIEGLNNIYFTVARARNSISATGALTYNSLSGVISWNGTSDDVREGSSNLYYTESRFSGSINAQKNISNGIAGLDANAKVSLMNLPGITMNAVWSAIDKADCTTKNSATRGDICIATSDSRSYVLSSTNYSMENDWQELLNPSAPVSMVNGQVGNINFVGTNGLAVSGTTLSLTNIGTGGVYGSATAIPIITTDTQGRVTNVTVTTIPTATASQLGLLSATDYVRFEGKQDLISTGTTAQYYRGDKTWANLDTTVVTEGTNRYFTESRSLSSTLTGFTAGIGVVNGSDTVFTAFQKLQGTNTAQDTNLSTISGSLTTTNTNLLSLSGVVATKIGLTSLSAAGPLTYNSGSGLFGILQSSSSVSGFLSSTDWATFNNKIGNIGIGNGLTLSGTSISLSLANSTTTGALSSKDWNTFNNKINLTSLSATGGISYNSGTGLFSDIFTFSNGLTRTGNNVGMSLGSAGQVLFMSGSSPIWVNASTIGGVTSFMSRTGAVVGIAGDYTTSQITESGSLYFTTARARSALSVTGSVLSYSGSTGILGISQASATLGGFLSSTDWNTFNNKINLTSLSATGGISYNSGTGLFSDIFTFSNGLTRTGNNVGIGTLTGGMMTGFTTGQLAFGTASGGLTQSSSLFWDNTNGRLGIGTNTPNSKLEVNSGIGGKSGLRLTQMTSISTTTTANGKALSVDGNGEVILVDSSSIDPSISSQNRNYYPVVNNYVTDLSISANKSQLTAVGGATLGTSSSWNGKYIYPMRTTQITTANIFNIPTSYISQTITVDPSLSNTYFLQTISDSVRRSVVEVWVADSNGTPIARIQGHTTTSLVDGAKNTIHMGPNQSSANVWGRFEWLAYSIPQSIIAQYASGTSLKLALVAGKYNTEGNLVYITGWASATNPFMYMYENALDILWSVNSSSPTSTHATWYGDWNNAGLSYFETKATYSGLMVPIADTSKDILLTIVSINQPNRAEAEWTLVNKGGTASKYLGQPQYKWNTVYNGGKDQQSANSSFYITAADLQAFAYRPANSGMSYLKFNVTNNSIDTSYIKGYFLEYATPAVGSVSGVNIINNSLGGLVSMMTGATLDNMNNPLSWNWSNATTETLFGLSANNLTTGTLFDMTTSGSLLNSVKGFFRVANTSNPTNTGGIFARFQPNNTLGAGLTMLNNGNIGIGTGSPNAPLQFANTLANRKIVLWETANNDNQYYGIGINNGIMRYQVDSTTSAHVFYAATGSTASTELMRISGNGNVGIGTSNPQALLHLYSNSSWPSYIVEGGTSTTGVNGLGLKNSTGYMYNVGIGGGSNSANPNSFFIWDGNASKMRMTINASGYVGIGVDNALGSLHINGGVLARGGSPGTGGGNNNGYAFNGNGGDNDSGMFSNTDGQLNFYTNGVERLRLSSSNGSNYASYDGDSNWDFYSDMRLKKDIDSAESVLDRILQLPIKRYNFKEGDPRNFKEMGVIAQDVQGLFPDLVTSSYHPAIGSGALSVAYTAFGTLALKGIQELAENTASTGAVDTLSGKLLSLSGVVDSQSVALSQMQYIVKEMQSLSGSNNTISGSSTTTTINNYYNTSTVLSGSLSSSGYIFPMSGTGQIAADTLTAIQSEAPRSVLSFIQDLFSHMIEVIREIIVLQITAVRGYFDEILVRKTTSEELHTNTLCVKKSNGNEVCITGDQLELLLSANASINTNIPPTPSNPDATSSLPSTSSSSTETEIPPSSNTDTVAPAENTAPSTDLNTPAVDTPTTESGSSI